MSTNALAEPLKTPINDFAAFFKNYTIGLALIVATMPVLVTKFELLPMFSSLKGSLSFITSLTSYLLVGFLWSKRQFFGKKLFPYDKVESGLALSKSKEKSIWFWGGFVPGSLIVLTILCFWLYHALVPGITQKVLLNYSSRVAATAPRTITADSIETRSINRFGLSRTLDVVAEPVRDQKDANKILSYDFKVVTESEEIQGAVLKNLPSMMIPDKFWLYLSFLGIFLCASTAFIMMGLKDYLQSKKGLSDDAIEGAYTLDKASFYIPGYEGVYGRFEYLRDDASYRYKEVFVYSHSSGALPLSVGMNLSGKGVHFYYMIYDDKARVDRAVEVVTTEEGDLIDFEQKLQQAARERFNNLHPKGVSAEPAQMKIAELHG